MSDRIALTVAEAAERLGVHERTMYRWVKSGEVPSRRVGGRVLVPVIALERMFEEQAS